MPVWADLTVQYILPITLFIFGIIFFIWRVVLDPSNRAERAIHTFIFKLFTKKMDVEKIAKRINELGLHIENGDSLTIQSFVDANRWVYFPVVPKPNLSVIHLVFLKQIEELQKIGLKVRVLVFDDYYRRKERMDPKAAKIQIDNFINKLKEHTTKRFKLDLESKLNKKERLVKRLYNRELDLCSRFNIREIKEIRELTAPTTDDDKPYIMQEKVIFNMLYLTAMHNIGFVLCGQDEIELWKKFVNKEAEISVEKSTITQMIILSIPLMKNSSGQAMSMWVGNNLYTNITQKQITEEIFLNIKDDEYMKPSYGVFYLLDNLYFSSENATISLPVSSGNIQVNNINELIKEIAKRDCNYIDKQVAVLAQIIFNILHNKK